MASRKSWGELTEAYRHRLERAGVTAESHATANLTEERGHPTPPPPGAAPAVLVERLLDSAERTPQDFERAVSEFTRPSWIPQSAPIDVAAALSRLPNPKRWDHVTFDPKADGEPWTMTVYLKGNAYPRTIPIPGGGGPGTGAKDVLQIVTDIQRGPRARRNLEAESIFFEVHETDEEAGE